MHDKTQLDMPTGGSAPTRRDFIDRLALGAAALGGFTLMTGSPATAAAAAMTTAHASLDEFGAVATNVEWDVKWPARLTGKVNTVFDVPEVESGYGVWRASIWAKQYEAVLGEKPADLSTALVLRHNAIVLAMGQAFWDRYGIGRMKSVTHPATLAATDRNPVLLSSRRGEVPAAYDAFALDQFIARGGVVLACDLALRDCVALIAKEEGVGTEEAHRRAVAYLVPGVVLQPSGVFAVLRAQQAGAIYIRAS
jgi:hypothetical protein